jgi:hypothetical protein
MPGGGGGGGTQGGGGGAGGVIHKTNYPVTAGANYTIVVGQGGAGGYQAQDGVNGDDSTFSGPASQAGLRAYGGGGGLARDGSYNSTGGSGGGKTILYGADGKYIPSGTSTVIDAQQGYPGGQARVLCCDYAGGGGGGAGGVGGDAPSCGGGAGGPGVQSDITGVSTWYAAGGGGGSDQCVGGAAGLGGSGAGGTGAYSAASPGRPDSGDGGGGQSFGQAGAGGSGIVIIRY